MTNISNDDYVYFLYSQQQFKEKNEILNRVGKKFVAGTVMINGTRKRFTELSKEKTLRRFIDTTIIEKIFV